MRTIIRDSVDYGLRIRPVRWIMLSGPFLGGVMAYAFYAMQPYLLELYGDPNAYGVAGLAAAIVAGAQILGGLLVPQIRRVFHERTTILLVAAAVSIGSLFVAGALNNFWATVVVLALWATSMSAAMPVRQAYINALIPSTQRATVLSFDSMVTSTGGVVAQPALGKAADLWSYGTSLVIGSIVQIGAVPFLLLARREHSPSDEIRNAVNDEPDDEPERA